MADSWKEVMASVLKVVIPLMGVPGWESLCCLHGACAEDQCESGSYFRGDYAVSRSCYNCLGGHWP